MAAKVFDQMHMVGLDGKRPKCAEAKIQNRNYTHNFVPTKFLFMKPRVSVRRCSVQLCDQLYMKI